MKAVSPPPRALLSVWDKTGIVAFAQGLVDLGFEILSTGGTARKLSEAGLDVRLVSDVTQHPEIFDGRVKSLHPAIHGPLLARLHQEKDAEELTQLGYAPIRVVACNLYPFGDAAAKTPPLSNDELLEKLESNLEEVRARGGELYVFADPDTQLKAQENVHVIEMPRVGAIVAPILYTLPLQLLAYHVAVLKGTDVDQPRNLAKSVTVE